MIMSSKILRWMLLQVVLLMACVSHQVAVRAEEDGGKEQDDGWALFDRLGECLNNNGIGGVIVCPIQFIALLLLFLSCAFST